MSKAMIIIDVPDHLDITQFKVDCKLVNKVYINYPSMDIKLFDLKSIPKKRNLNAPSIGTFNEGYNACLMEILGETK